MTPTFKNGPSLYRLLESAPLTILSEFLTKADKGKFASYFAAVPWQDKPEESGAAPFRKHLTAVANEMPATAAAELDRLAQRVLTLAEGRGVEAINRVAEQLFAQERIDAYRAQLNALGRSLWLFLTEYGLFDDAECLFHANHFRNVGRMYEAFELGGSADVQLVWNDEVRTTLEAQLKEMLEVPGRCRTTHLRVTERDHEGREQVQHLIIVRHGGLPTSVPNFDEVEGISEELHYRPLNEAMLLYSPHSGVIEIISTSPGVRQQIAACFAENILKMDLSDRPLTLKQYNFSRFLTSLRLDCPAIPGVDIERVAVVDVEARPDNPMHRAGLKVSAEDDIEDVAVALFGQDHLFKRATSLARIVIAVKYTPVGESKAKTLNITLSEPNRCNLRSNRDPVQRELGYALLSAWNILRSVEPMTPAQEQSAFPALLQLYDQTSKEVAGQFFLSRKLNLDDLLTAGFIEKRGRYTTLRLEDEGIAQEVDVRTAGRPGVVYYEHPVDGGHVELPITAVEKYGIKLDWLNEIVLKKLGAFLLKPEPQELDKNLTFLGQIQLGVEVVPCYLARDLRTPATLQRLDVLMRAMSGRGIGLVLAAGRDTPKCLGPNVVLAVADFLAQGIEERLVNIDALALTFNQAKQLARGGMVVDFARHGNYSATLSIPGKPPLLVTGTKAIKFIEALVNAYNLGAPVIPTKQLLQSAGSESKSPSQLFPKGVWASIEGVYVGPPPGHQRGYFQLLT